MKHVLLLLLSTLLLCGEAFAQRKGSSPATPVQTADTESVDEDDDAPPPPSSGPGFLFRDEVRAPFVYGSNGDVGGGAGGGIELHRYFSGRIHDETHRSLFSEAVALPSSSIDIGASYLPNPALLPRNRGYMIMLGGVTMVSKGTALGGNGRYSRSKLADTNLQINDFEFGPRVSFWPGERIYIDDQLLYRHIGGYGGGALRFRVSDEEYFTLRHHLAYVVNESRDLTYAHDVEMRIGIHQNYHVNNFTMLNYFLFSTSQSFSFGPVAGFSLDYTLGPRTSVLTIPILARAEVFFGMGHGVVMAQLGYDTPTMPGQTAGQVQLQGSLGYRF
jgi:hypothetical protein